jgi:hypothetical protein
LVTPTLAIFQPFRSPTTIPLHHPALVATPLR